MDDYRVLITDKALAEIDSVLAWLQEQGATTASQRWFSAIWISIDTLQSHPERCALASEASEIGREIRELYFGKRRGTYHIVFEIRGKTVDILRVWHSSRDGLTAADL
jgi:plasmid stabilization system protein ParE